MYVSGMLITVCLPSFDSEHTSLLSKLLGPSVHIIVSLNQLLVLSIAPPLFSHICLLSIDNLRPLMLLTTVVLSQILFAYSFAFVKQFLQHTFSSAIYNYSNSNLETSMRILRPYHQQCIIESVVRYTNYRSNDYIVFTTIFQPVYNVKDFLEFVSVSKKRLTSRMIFHF